MNIKNNKIHLTMIIPETFRGLRLDQALAEIWPEYSRNRLQEWIKNKQVLVDSTIWRTRDKVNGGETVEINAEIDIETSWQPQSIALNIVYEDAELLIINKPAGMVVHPGAGNHDNTLVNALLHYAPELAQLPRAGIIHRIDKDTSGLLVVPRTLTAHTHLVTQIQNRTIKREYEAIVNGLFISGGTVNAPIGRHPIHRKRMAVTEGGKNAVTHYRVIERFTAHTHIKVLLETGRTHQIRVHMAHLKHPLLGDYVYNSRLCLPPKASSELINALQHFKRQALHAKCLGFIHPQTLEPVQWEVDLPDDMQQMLLLLRNSHE